MAKIMYSYTIIHKIFFKIIHKIFYFNKLSIYLDRCEKIKYICCPEYSVIFVWVTSKLNQINF